MSRTSKAELSPRKKRRGVQGQRGRGSVLAATGLCFYWPAIFIISHIPKAHVPKGITVSGATVHLIAYFVLTLLVFASAGLAGSISLRSKKTWLFVGIIAVYAMLDEYVQSFIQGRHGGWEDWADDISACLFCVGLLRLLGWFRRGRGQFSKKSQG